jgi:shikimate kinase
VALIGFMGSGKSSVGALLAARLGYHFLDLDALIEERVGKPIRRIFEQDGEEAFRELETRALQDLPGAATFYLEISFDVFWKRTASDPARPLLRKSREELRRLYESRLPAYREAGLRVDAGSREPAEVVTEILRLLESEPH